MEKFNFAEIDANEVLREVIKCYEFSDAMKIKLLKYSENLTYLLYCDYDKEKKYVLRVFRPGYHDDSELAGELIWINQITKDTDVRTANVYMDKNGSFVSDIVVEGNKLHCALFAYIDGKSLNDLTKAERLYYLEKMGEVMAKLHLQSMNWTEVKNVKRFSWDIDDLIGENARWGQFTLMKGLPDEYMESYKKAAEIIRKRVEKFGRSRERYGLIHDDISINNVLVYQNEIYLLDFDDCGWGWFLYDLPTGVLEDFGESMEEGMLAILRGYEKFRPLSEEEKNELKTFNLLKKIVRIGWIATRSDNDTVKKVKSDYFCETAKMAQEYIQEFGKCK